MTQEQLNAEYLKLDRRRAGQLGQVTRIQSRIDNFDPLVNSAHVLINYRANLNNANVQHQAINNEMMNHANAEYEVIDELGVTFSTAYCAALANIDRLERTAEHGSTADNAATLQNEIAAIKVQFAEFQEVTCVENAQAPSPHEARLRLKDLQKLHAAFTTAWEKLFLLATAEQMDVLIADQRKTTNDCYRVMGWFESKSSQRLTQIAPRPPNPADAVVKLPKIELQTFDGKPDTWVTFRDSFKSLVHNVPSLTGALKFRYLKSTITDKFSPIQHLLETDDGYEDAWQAVLDYYDDIRRIVDCHVSGILKIRSMETESHDELQRVLNEFSLHITSLERMHTEEELYQAILAHLALQRLDPHTRDLWETENSGEVPFWPDLKRFLVARRKTLSTMPDLKPSQPRSLSRPNGSSGSKFTGKVSSTHTATKSPSSAASDAPPAVKGKPMKCHSCRGDHRLHQCPQFLNLTIPSRLSKVRDWNICSNCFGAHTVSSCTSPFKCRTCKQRHHTMLHLESPAPQQSSAHSLQAAGSQLMPDATPFLFPTSSCHAASRRNHTTLLQTAMVQIQDAHGEWHTARAFLDSGSDSNYVTTSVATALKLKLHPTHIEANGLGGNCAAVIRHKIMTRVGTNAENFEMELLVTPKVTNLSPPGAVAVRGLGIPPNLPLADPTFHVPGRIDILIGNEHYGDLIRDGRIKLPSGPTMLNTVFGWILSGSVPETTGSSRKSPEKRSIHTLSTQCSHNTLVELKEAVEKFYKLEDYRNDRRFLTDEEAHCEKVFEQTHVRMPDGRFKIFLPLKENLKQLANNYRNALVLFFVLEKRLQKNEKLRADYVKFMREFIDLGHMTEIDISNESPTSPAFYFPHHAVVNPDSSTTKLRVVFNGSARTSSGISFNDTQCVGPQIQSDVFTLALRFRLSPVVIKADVEKMYRQVEVAEPQRKFQRIIWRENPAQLLKVYTLNTVTYGTASASFQATRCLKELAITNRENFPKAAEEILNSFYVDDYISGANTVEEATALAQDVIKILGSAQMKLRKFNSNSGEFLRSIPDELRESPKDDAPIKALGIKWDPVSDTIGIDVKPVQHEKVTRRIMLSELHRPYDPEGILGPVTFRFKLFLKRIFQLSIPWDAPVPAKDAEDWTELASNFPALSQVRLPRCIAFARFGDVQLHGFCDASDEGYGIVIYVRSRDRMEKVMSRLICSKSRVAPSEYRSTARLELCGAVMLANMMQQVSAALKLPFSKKICWSDSAIVLQWLKKSPAILQIFVANRVSEIQELSTDLTWRHIRGPLNPADLISRGLAPLEIIDCSLWWNGPDFLVLPERQWPESIVEVDPKEPSFTQEFKKIESLVHATSVVEHDADPTDPASNLFLSWIDNSSRTWVVKVKLAPIMRFIFNVRAKTRNTSLRTGPMQVQDMMDAEMALARIYQLKHFPSEFHRCSIGKPIPPRSPIKNLDPFWDPTLKLMRVGGRLNNAEHCEDNQKHPIVLPNCHFSRLVIRETHQRNFHAGQNATHSFVRMRYWPLRGKVTVRQEVHKCITCFRVRPQMTNQFMGQLPASRTTPSPPFSNTGVDYCGPFDIKLSKLRTAKTGKAYVALFVCLATKAIHLEIVTDLSTQAFFAAFDKFISRRGLPQTMMSDNGLNFVGASNELQELYAFLAQETVQVDIRSYLAENEVNWSFIPPSAPAQGGLWEAGVKSMKHHFHRVAKNSLLTFEEFDRLKAKIEAILNSRPLTALSDDPSDLSALTAGHFLIGRPLIAKPDRDLSHHNIHRLQRWDRIVHMQQGFWKRWSCDYLHQLQVRTKNYQNVVPVSVGQLVLLHVDNTPPMCWPLGRITRIYPGKDGVTRVASIKTANSTLERPVDKLALLPIDPQDDFLEPAEDVRVVFN